ncbi:hypothetical protein A1D22_05885 [Pasteurellaceae bacterium LFhippo2]|nr:hypothetical protein [Pasteurellaceae bacterium LFhippo2]
MQYTAVQSSNLSKVGYDETYRVLEIHFHNGGVYQYLNVPPNHHQQLLIAWSKGKYLASYVKPYFQSKKIK